ncbi:hypothetical protein [Alkalicoccobacillus porphyridii]|uniref:Uncharacterized protein n=1 Tax=Alkalicoccobacillus porphyridii TaxID=2597270 RepID=A0A554A3X7_9BACI|nr:hypothetical protein [Alkalicoccobacillus porphyridii]TSB48366.1 hypothetical protein FN960_02085 [Alkalicoccobacillus porphyridii]
MLPIVKRIAAIVMITLFISGFFFLDEGKKKPASGEKETVVADNEEIMAIRMVHNATAFKLTQLQQEQAPLSEMENELHSYLGGELLQQSLTWLEENESTEIESFLRVDTAVSPVVEDEVADQITLIWGSPRQSHNEVTYKKINDVWKAIDMNTASGSE